MLKLLVLAGPLSLLALNAYAATGRTTGSFLKMGVGARSVAMGETQVAAVEDATALYWNPAALDKLNQKEIALMHNQYFLGVTHDVFSYAQPTMGKGTFGAGISYLNVADVEGYGKAGEKTGNLTVTDTLLTVGWGKKWDSLRFPDLYTGMNVKYLEKQLGAARGRAMLADVGMYYQVKGRWLKGLQTGFVLENLSNGITFIQEKEKLPQRMKAGVAYPVFGESVVLAADYVMPRGEGASFNVGMDYRLWDILSFRMGYKGQNNVGGGLSYGIGIGKGNLRVDYAFVASGEVGNTHRVSVGYRFGTAKREVKVESQVERAYGEAMSSYAQGYVVDAYMKASAVTEVAPWHRPAQALMEKVQGELKELEGMSRKSEFESQIENHFERGVSHFEKDEMIQAKREFEVILTLQPDHPGAKSYLERITERFRNMAANFFEVGMKQFTEGQYQEAKEYFQKVLVMDPSHPEAGNMIQKTETLLAEVKSQREEKEKIETARQLFQTALGDFEGKRYEEAGRKLEEVLGMSPEFTEAKRYRTLCRNLLARQAFDGGMKAMQSGSWNAAIQAFQKAIALKPDYTEAQSLLEKLVARQGEQKKTESIQLYKQGLETLLTGDKEKTRKLWQKAAEIWPENLDAKRGLERLSSERGHGN